MRAKRRRVHILGAQVFLAKLSLLINGCAGMQSALDPAGLQAGQIANLWWFFFAVCLGVFLLVLLSLLYAVFRPRRGQAGLTPEPINERCMAQAVTSAVVVTILLLFGLLVVSISTGRSLASFSVPNALIIKVTGHQWWWEVQYEDPVPSQMVITANEIHIPVGQPIKLR